MLRGEVNLHRLIYQNFSALSKGGTQQISLMNIAMELKKAS